MGDWVGWTGGFLSLLALSILFPSARLPAGRWRIPAIALICAAALTVALTAFAPTIAITPSGSQQAVTVPNPVALFPELSAWKLLPSPDVLALIVMAELALGGAGIVLRYRGAIGLERLQLRWFVAALASLIVALIIGLLTVSLIDGFAWLPVAVAYPTIPAAITVAVLRYRLYDIDLLIKRTVLYGAVTLTLAVLFGLANVAAQRLVESLTGRRSDVVTAALAVAQPWALRRSAIGYAHSPNGFSRLARSLTLFFTDIVESTRRAAELGDERWRDLLGRYRSAVRRELARFGGHEVDTAGDGFFATFERSVSAAHCALQVRAGCGFWVSSRASAFTRVNVRFAARRSVASWSMRPHA